MRNKLGLKEKELTLSILLALSVPLTSSLQPLPVSAEQVEMQSQSASSAEYPTSLDLTSTSATLTANLEAPLSIQVGGSLDTTGAVTGGSIASILPGQLLTPAQALVVSQIASTGFQSLVIAEAGHAIGGFANLHADTLSALNSIVVPQNVSLNSIGFTASNPLTVLGAVNIAGSLNALQTAPGITSALNFGSLNLTPGGMLSGYLPTSYTLPGNFFSSQGLNLNVIGNLSNLGGTITTPGHLEIMAGSVINQSLGNMAALISAQTVNISAMSGAITNSGLITAIDTINIQQRQSLANLLFNNSNGVLESLGGAINIRNTAFMEKLNTSIIGGDLLSRELNINGGNGNVAIEANDIRGLVNVTGAVIKIAANTDHLQIGSITATEDPLISNALDVSLNASVTTSGGPLSIVAGRNILANANNIELNTSSTTGNGGEILLVAGADFTIASGALTITGGSATGGLINLNQSSTLDINALSSRGSTTSGNGNGGNITLVAYQGSGTNSGTINLPTGVTATTGGRGTGTNGNFTAIAGREAAGANTLVVGPISTAGTASSTLGGSVVLSTSSPVLSGGSVVINTTTGAVTAGSFSAAGILADGSVSSRAITTDGGAVSILAGRNINTNNTSITSSKAAGTGTGGNVTLLARDGSIDFNTAGDILTRGRAANSGKVDLRAGTTLRMDQINTNPASGNTNGGNVLIATGGSVLRLGTITTSGLGTTGNAGRVNVVSGQDITLTNNIAAGGTGTGSGGSITLAAGAAFSSAGGNLSITGQSTTGGSIIRTGGTSISSRATGTAGNGGDLNLIAYEGTTGSAGSGRINTLTAVGFDSRGAGAGSAGNVTIIAGDNDSAGAASVSTGAITTAGGSGGTTGTIKIGTAAPLLGGIVINETSGAVTGSFDFNAGALLDADISTLALSTNGKDISLSAGNDVRTTNATISASRTAGNGAGGAIILTAGTGVITLGTGSITSSGINASGGTINANASTGITAAAITASAGTNGTGGIVSLNNTSGNITTGAITANGAGAAATGGSISIVTPGNITTLALSATGSGTGAGGSILSQVTGTGVMQTTGAISANGGSGGGGSVSLQYNAAAGGNFTLGSISGNSVSGSITAASTTGNGGTVTISNSNAGGALSIVGSGAAAISSSGLTSAGSINLNKPGSAVSVNLTGALTGAVNATGTSVFLSSGANSNILTAGNLNASTGSVTVQNTGTNAGVRVLGNISAATSATVTGTGSGTISRTGGAAVISADSLTISTGSGAIGAAGTPILTNVNSLTVGTTGAAFVSDVNGVTLNSSTLGSLTLTAGGTGSIALNGNLTGTGTVNLNAGGDLTNVGGFLVTAPTIDITAGGSIGASGATFNTTATTLTANATTGDVFVAETNGLALGNSSAAGSFNLTAGGTLTTVVGSTLTAPVTVIAVTGAGNDITLNSNINASTSLSLTAADAITRTAGTLTSPAITLASTGAGAIGSAAQNIQTNANTLSITNGGATFVNDTDGITLNASTASSLRLSSQAGGTIALGGNTTTTGSLTLVSTGDITNIGGHTLAANALSLTATGNIADGSNELLTNATSLTLSAGGAAFINEANTLSVGLSSTGSDLSITAAGTISTTGALSASAVALTATGSGNDIALGSNLTATGTISLSAADAITRSAGTLSAPAVTLAAGGDIGTVGQNIQTDTGEINVSTTGAVFINEANAVTLNATNVGSLKLSTAGAGAITLGGNVTTSGTLSLLAAGDIDNAGAFTLQADTLNLSAGVGASIGTASNQVLTTANTLTLSAGANAYISETDAVNVGLSTVGQILSLTAPGTITTTAAVSANNIILSTATLTVNAALSGTTSISLSNAAGVTINGTGSINTISLNVNSSAGGVNIVLPSITGVLTGNAAGSYFASTTVSALSVTNLSAVGGALNLSAGSNLTATGNLVAGTQLVLNAGSALSSTAAVSAPGSIALTSTGNSNVTGTLTSTGSTVTISSTTGSVQLSDGTTVTSHGDTTISAALSAQLGGAIGANGAGVVINAGSLTAAGENATDVLPENSAISNGSILLTTGTGDITLSDNVSLTSRGGEGTPAVPGSLGLSSGADIITGNNVALTAKGGDLWLKATDDITLGLNNSLTSLAKLSDGGGTFTTSAGSVLPDYVGGRTGIVAGLPGLNVPAELQTLVNQRSSFNVLNISAGTTFNAGSPNLTLTGGSIFKATGGAGLSIDPAAGNIYQLSGAVLLIQAAPGRTINLNGAQVTAAGPTIAPLPVTTPASSAPLASQTQISSSNVFSFNAPQFVNTGVGTDRLNMNIGLPAQQQSTVLALSSTGNSATLGNAGPQPFYMEDSTNALVIGMEGTNLSIQSEFLNMESGRLAILAGDQPYSINTLNGTVELHPGSSAIIEMDNGQLRVSQLDGSSTITSTSGKIEVAAGDKIVIGKSDRTKTASGQSKTAGYSVTRTLFNQKDLIAGESLLNDASDSQPNAKTKIDRLRSKIQADAPDETSMYEPEAPLRPVAFTTAPHTVTMPRLNALSTPSAIITQSGGAQFKVNGDTIELFQGEILINTTKPTLVRQGTNRQALIAPGTIVQLRQEDGVTLVRNLYETHRNSVRQTEGSVHIDIAAGVEFIGAADNTQLKQALNSDSTGRRALQMLDLPNGKGATSEFSLLSAMLNSTTLGKVSRAKDSSSKKMTWQILKMAACIQHVSCARGPYTDIAR
ncbi:MAG: S-layer family protein [Candidatus Obscuribacterales bacterium]|nr:S-layer family protein [Candidatus Obscuribacterales bacterium]